MKCLEVQWLWHAAELGIDLQVGLGIECMYWVCRNPPIPKESFCLFIIWAFSLPSCSVATLHSDCACLPALFTPCSSWALWCCTSVARNCMWLPWSSPWHWAGLTCCTTPVASSKWAFTLSWLLRLVQWVDNEGTRVLKHCQQPHFQHRSHHIYLHHATGWSSTTLLYLATVFPVKWHNLSFVGIPPAPHPHIL